MCPCLYLSIYPYKPKLILFIDLLCSFSNLNTLLNSPASCQDPASYIHLHQTILIHVQSPLDSNDMDRSWQVRPRYSITQTLHVISHQWTGDQRHHVHIPGLMLPAALHAFLLWHACSKTWLFACGLTWPSPLNGEGRWIAYVYGMRLF